MKQLLKSHAYLIASLVLLTVLFAANIHRAATQSITGGEAPAFRQFVTTVDSQGDSYARLSRLAVKAFGLSEFTLRLPAVAGGLLYFGAIFFLSRLLFGNSVWLVVAVALSTLNLLVLDYCSAAQGFGVGMALWMLGAYFCARWVADRKPVPIAAGAALGLAVAFDFSQIFAVAALEIVFVAGVVFDRLMAKDRRGAIRFIVRDALPFCLVSVAALLWMPLHRSLPGVSRFRDGLKSLANAFVLYNPAFLTSWGSVHRFLERLSWLLLVVLLVALAIAAVRLGRQWFRARSQSRGPLAEARGSEGSETSWASVLSRDRERTVGLSGPETEGLPLDRTGRLLLLFSVTVLLTFLLLWIEPKIARHGYFALRGLVFTLPMISTAFPLWLRWSLGGGRQERAVASAGATVAWFLLLGFALQFQTHSYFGWEFDAGTKSVMKEVQRRHSVALVAELPFKQSVDFYQRLYDMDWMWQVTGDFADCPADHHYYLFEEHFDRLSGLGLYQISRDSFARTIFAEFGIEARRRLAVLGEVGFSGVLPCTAGIMAQTSWIDVSRAGAARHFLRDFDARPDPDRWRWTYKRPAMLFHAPRRTPVRFKMDFLIPSETFRRTGPLRLTVWVNGKQLGRRFCDSPEHQTFEQTVPPELLRDDGVALVETTLDKYYVSPVDGQKLGYLFVRGGFLH